MEIKITTLSPIHIGSGKADVNLDAEIVHDKYGIPYFPGKRFRGLLYESALEITEMKPLQNKAFADPKILRELFNQTADTPVILTMHNFYPPHYRELCQDLEYLQDKYGDIIDAQDVLAYYTDIRFQTKIDDRTGIAADTSLHNMRVVDQGVDFVGELEVCGDPDRTENHRILLALALKNLRYAGSKRNRGFGKIDCRMTDDKLMAELIEKALRKE